MIKVLRGIEKHQVILLSGDHIRDVLKEQVFARYPHETFSAINMNIERVTTCLSSKRWDGTRPVVVFFRCEAWMKDIAILIRKRQPNQAVILVSDGNYTVHTPVLKSLAGVQVVIGKMPPTIFALLKRGPLIGSEDEPGKTTVRSYAKAIECTDINTIIDQIHYSNEDTDVSCALSDVDILRHRVPESVLVNCLPLRKSVEFTSNKKVGSKTVSNQKLLQTILPIVALSRSSMMSVHETLDYVRYAHQIQLSPEFARCPRDDQDPNLVRNVNDKIRVLSCMPITTKRKR
jgi:hypothetical protein